jgi:hypothetical protein
MAQGDFDGALSALEQTSEEEARLKEQRDKKRRLEEHIGWWRKRVDLTKEHDEKFIERWCDDRRMARGETDYDVDTNLIAAIMEVLLAFLYAKDPDIGVRPSAKILYIRDPDVAMYPSPPDEKKQNVARYREFAKTLEIVVSRMVRNARLKTVAKRWIRGSMTVGIGWLKVAMQRRLETDPIMETQINDLKTQLSNIRSKQLRMKDDDAERDRLIEEIEANLKAAEANLERMVAEGLVLDYVHPEDLIVAPECGEVENYLNSPWIAFDSFKTEDEVLEITGWENKEQRDYLLKANRYFKRPREGKPGESGEGYVLAKQKNDMDNKEADSPEGFFKIVEVWSKTDGVVYTYVEGCTEAWAREPYPPVTGLRFYPCFQLAFHYVDQERYPQSDVFQLKKLQNEYNDIRSDYRLHRKRAVPGILFDKTKLTDDSVSAVQKAERQEYVGIEMLDPERPIRDAFAPKAYNPIDPNLYDTSIISREMEKMSGVQDALQAAVQIEKTATEARIQESGFGARTGQRRDQLEEVLTDLAEYVAQLCLQMLDQADAEKYAGSQALWMRLTAEQAFTSFDFEIKAGSTGKPQATSDRETWGTLLPLIVQNVERIGAARLRGQEWAAKPYISILNETLERLDDHADIEKFLPEPPEEVVQAALSQQQTDPEEELNMAKKFKELATAIEKIPALAELPEVQELLNDEEAEQPGMMLN